MLQATFHAVTHGTSGLLLGYWLVAVPIFVGMWRGGAPLSRLLVSPMMAIPVMLIAALAVALEHPVLNGLGMSHESVLESAIGLASFAAIGYWTGRLAARRPSPRSSYRRGANLCAGDPMTPRRTESSAEKGVQGAHGAVARAFDVNARLTLGGIAVAPEDETKHFKLIGTTGTGKSTAIRELLHTAMNRGDRAIIADPDGSYRASFYDPDRGDIILNPFDRDSVKWDLFGEIRNEHDVEQLARSLIPDHGEADRSWSDYARTFFTAVVQQALSVQIQDDSRIYYLLTQATHQELKLLLARTAAGPFLEEGNERMFGSVRSVTSAAVRALRYTTGQRGTPFSVREWVRKGAARSTGGKGGALFLPYKAGEIAALRSMISAWMRIAIFEAMHRGEGDQRLWFVVDELDALGEIDGLKDALARLRKFGGRTILGFQSIAQVSGTYGKSAADTIVENCGNTLILRCSSSEHGGTSEFASKLIGQREVLHTTRARTRRSTEWFGSTTTSEQIRIEPAILASEIERLPDLMGYLKFASKPDWRRVSLTPVTHPSVARGGQSGAASSPRRVLPADTPAASHAWEHGAGRSSGQRAE